VAFYIGYGVGRNSNPVCRRFGRLGLFCDFVLWNYLGSHDVCGFLFRVQFEFASTLLPGWT